MTAYTPALVAVLALVEVDTEGEVVETLTRMLTEEEEPDGPAPHLASLSLLLGAMQASEIEALRPLVGLCLVHGCDSEICADDDNPECASEREIEEE